MHEIQLARAVLPEPPTILRFKLKPYSLGHELHLYRRANPFVTLSKAEFDALTAGQRKVATMQAVHVCQQGFFASSKPAKGWGWFSFCCQFLDLKKSEEQMRQHIIAGHDSFESELPSGDGHMKVRYLGAPELLRLYHFVCDTVPLHEQRIYQIGRRWTVWDYPLSLATMHWQARAEMDGRLEVHSEHHRAVEQEIARREKAKAEEQEEPCPTR